MKRISLAIALTLVVVSSANAAAESDKGSALERYQVHTEGFLMLCPVRFQLAEGRAERGMEQDQESNYQGCIAEGKATARSNLDKALRAEKKSKARDALKSYHVAFVAALEGIRPGVGERSINYDRRQQIFRDKVNEAWARFEVEQ